MRRKALTLIELVISVVIISILMTFLYQIFNNIKLSNIFSKKQVDTLITKEKLYKTIYLDIINSKKEYIQIIDDSKDYTSITMKTKNSIYQRYEPYTTYIIKDKRLYRVESRKEYSFGIFSNSINLDDLGKFKRFKIYLNKNGGVLIDFQTIDNKQNSFIVPLYY
jgi:prepilin-type N-terminal cleavage/methylation domain-containing protein